MAAVQTRRWLHKFITITFSILVITIHLRLHQYAFDDAYIHFRVAKNLLETGRPYFNIDEAVKVSTSSGWVIVLTVLMSISRFLNLENNFPMLVSVFNALTTLGGMAVYTKIIGRLSKAPPSFLLTFVFAITYGGLVIPSSVGLMESSFALLTAGLGIYLLILSRREGFVFLGFSVYIRAELAIVILLAGISCILVKNIRLKDTVVFSGIGIMPLLLYDLFLFNTFMPHSVIAKSLVYLTTWEQTAGNILFYSLPNIAGLSSKAFLIGAGILFSSFLLISSQGAFHEWLSFRNFWPLFFCLWCALIMGGYIVGHVFMFDWYIPLYTVPILVAFLLYVNHAEASRSILVKGVLALFFAVSMAALSQTAFASVYRPGVFSLFGGGSRLKTYLHLGTVINKDYPDATLLSPEIGGLGYTFIGKILDPVGLASPDALDFHRTGLPSIIPPGYVRKRMPDLIVSYDIFAQELLHDEVISQYNIIQVPAYSSQDAIYAKDRTIFGSEYLRIYIRKDLPVSESLLRLGK